MHTRQESKRHATAEYVSAHPIEFLYSIDATASVATNCAREGLAQPRARRKGDVTLRLTLLAANKLDVYTCVRFQLQLAA
jgi:hypothetical protein